MVLVAASLLFMLYRVHRNLHRLEANVLTLDS